MSEARSSKSTQGKQSRYPSRYSDQYLTCAQYVSEMMCERKAAFEKTDLPRFFWKVSPKWKGYYFYQLKMAYSLLKEFECHILMKALRENNTFSLKNQRLKTELKKLAEQEALKEQVTQVFEEQVSNPQIVNDSRGKFHRPNKMGKLDE